MRETTYERVRAIASDVLQVPAERLTPRSSMETIESWDSLQHLNLILALEQEFDVQFEPEEMERAGSIEQMVALLETKI